ncbi:MAG: hypothetical protein Ct9H300mP25_04620 [Acidobacteriota bacterium]|nr:MAG: hypothetical protein Ct9H300mP25_04620 [Acidobacteriota bacterium]
MTVVLLFVCSITIAVGTKAQETATWSQWGGPHRNFITEVTGLADSWPDGGPPVRWSRTLGTGHSAIISGNNRLYTMYRVGNGQGREGPWEAEETVIP